jgi:hypothetical protein
MVKSRLASDKATCRKNANGMQNRAVDMGSNLEFTGSSVDTFSVLAIHNINEPICVVEIMSPKWTQLLLSSDIPDSKKHVPILNFLYIKTCIDMLCEEYLSIHSNYEMAHALICKMDFQRYFCRPWCACMFVMATNMGMEKCRLKGICIVRTLAACFSFPTIRGTEDADEQLPIVGTVLKTSPMCSL